MGGYPVRWGPQLSHFSPWPQNIGKTMSCQEFISNLNGLQDGGNFPKELLKVRVPGLPAGRLLLGAWSLVPGQGGVLSLGLVLPKYPPEDRACLWTEVSLWDSLAYANSQPWPRTY